MSASMQFFALMYGIFCVKEPAVYEKRPKVAPASIMADFFDKSHVVETFRVAFKNGARQRRLRVIMLIVVVMVVDGPLHGEFFFFFVFKHVLTLVFIYFDKRDILRPFKESFRKQ